MALTRRAALIDRMEVEARRADRSVSTTCFEILCGLPFDTQIAAAVAPMKRFLPLYERMQPGTAEPRRALDDPAAWLAANGRASPLEHDPAPLAESAFAMAFDGLLIALAYGADAYSLTSGCSYAIRMAVVARADAVWMADEPSVIELFEAEAPPHAVPSPFDNVAWTAVSAREWGLVASWLRRPEVVSGAEPIAPEQLAMLVSAWIDHEEIAVVPRPDVPAPRPIDWAAVDARVTARVAAGDPAPVEQVLAEEIEREQHQR
jgi:hypothetical protein